MTLDFIKNANFNLNFNKKNTFVLTLLLLLGIYFNTSAQNSAQTNQSFSSVQSDIAPVFGCGFLEGGYSSKMSVYQGDNISFYVSTKPDIFTLKIYRFGKTKELVAEIPNVPGGLKEVKEEDEAYVNGCRWNAAVKDFKIPDNWKAGAYLAEFPVQSDTTNPILFFVKEKDVLKRSKIILACATNTYQAYNMFGGKSSYPAYSNGGNNGTNYSVRLSFNRPFNRNNHHGINRASFYSFDSKLIKWLEEFGYGNNIDVISDSDLDSDPEYLSSHKVLFICGHSEYWSRGMRENVESFINNGGHFMCLSGNTCWWQIRFENDYRTLVCYKHLEDPVSDPQSATMEWIRIRRENSFIGTSYENGGQANYGSNPGCLNSSLGYGGYIIYNSQHWAFKNSNFHDGDTLGWRGDSSIVGYETDAALFKFQNGIPVATGADETPLNFRFLGISPANSLSQNEPKEWATMGIFKYSKPGSGFVFNAATIRWVWGLYSKQSKVSVVTKNILDHFLSNKFPPELLSWSPCTAKTESLFTKTVSFHSCTKELQYGKNMSFSITAKNYNNEEPGYRWAVNDTIVKDVKGSSFIYQSIKHPYGSNRITVYVYNSQDTSSFSWNIMSTAGVLAITSIPDTVIVSGQPYRYELNHYSRTNDQVKYTTVYLPVWAKFDASTNTIEGIPNCSLDSIKVIVEDQHGNIDSQSFFLRSPNLTSTYNNSAASPDYNLSQNYPNPFNPSTTISYTIPEASHIVISVYDILGNEVTKLVDEYQSAGKHSVLFNGSSLSSGIYIYKIEAGRYKAARKLTLLK